MSDKTSPALRPPKTPLPFPIEAVQEAVESIRYGVVQLIIQDGRIVQIDKTEKIRLA
jgi:hypothetical protein